MSDTRALVYLGTSHFFWSCYPVFHLLWVILSKSFCGGNQHHTSRPRLLERPLKLSHEAHPATLWEGQVLLPQRMKNNCWFWELPVVHLWQGLIFRDVACTPSLKSSSAMCFSVNPPKELALAKNRGLCTCAAFGLCLCKLDSCQITLSPVPCVQKIVFLSAFLEKLYRFLSRMGWDAERRIISWINWCHFL